MNAVDWWFPFILISNLTTFYVYSLDSYKLERKDETKEWKCDKSRYINWFIGSNTKIPQMLHLITSFIHGKILHFISKNHSLRSDLVEKFDWKSNSLTQFVHLKSFAINSSTFPFHFNDVIYNFLRFFIFFIPKQPLCNLTTLTP